MSTLRYANRAKNIKNKPTKNEDPKDAMLRDMQQEMERLRAMLEGEQAPDGVRITWRSFWTPGIYQYLFVGIMHHIAAAWIHGGQPLQ